MKIPQISIHRVLLAVVAIAGALTLTPHPAYADAAPMRPIFSGLQAPPPIAPAPTAQGRLDATQHDLEQAQIALGKVTTTHGGYTEQARAGVKQTLADVAEASVYVQAHPEVNPLPAGPAPADTPRAHFTLLPAGNRVPGVNLIAALSALNAALNELITTPVPGDFGGYRVKIMDDIAKTSSSVVAAVNNADQPSTGPSSNPATTSSRTGEAKMVIVLTEADIPATISIPRNLLGSQAAAVAASLSGGSLPANPLASATLADADVGGHSLVPTAIAGLALSVAISLGGLHFFSRKRALSTPLALVIAGIMLALTAVAVYADIPGPPPPPSPQNLRPQLPATPAALPQVSGPVIIKVVENGDMVTIVLPRKLAANLASSPPAR